MFGIYLYYSFNTAKNQIYHDVAQSLKANLQTEKELIQNIGIINTTLIADNKHIKDALKHSDRSMAIKELNIISNRFKNKTNIQHLKIHIHTKDIKSFVRNWKLSKYGDDLKEFRKTIIKVKETLKPVFAFEVGRIGLTFRTIVPILDGTKYLGSLEFIQAFDNFSENFEENDNQYLLLMNNSLLPIAKYLKSAEDLGHYKVSSLYYNKTFLSIAKQINLNTLEESPYLLSNGYLFTYEHIKDLDGNIVGMHLLATPEHSIIKMIESKKHHLYLLSIIIFTTIIILVVFTLLIRKQSTNN